MSYNVVRRTWLSLCECMWYWQLYPVGNGIVLTILGDNSWKRKDFMSNCRFP